MRLGGKIIASSIGALCALEGYYGYYARAITNCEDGRTVTSHTKPDHWNIRIEWIHELNQQRRKILF